MKNNLTTLPNIGNKLAELLLEVGIDSVERFKEIGAKEVFLRIKMHYPDKCINTLYALWGAEQGVRWGRLSKEEKEKIKIFFGEIDE